MRGAVQKLEYFGPVKSYSSELSERRGNLLFPAEAMAHASHHILTEQYFADAADECEAERARIEKRLNDNPLTDKTISGRMLIANLLNPVLVPYGPGWLNAGEVHVLRTDICG
ncbi:hypothetical protein B0H10DRAFT_1965050 [Mycena sp. CBHHK59/15]|nr:hypothetical protein B0H10DRAFT_1965050 [Mycena sp. CBHHK59/15]